MPTTLVCTVPWRAAFDWKGGDCRDRHFPPCPAATSPAVLYLPAMEPLKFDRRVFAADPPPAGQPVLDDMSVLRDAYLDLLTDPANGYSLEQAFPLPADLPRLYAQLRLLHACFDSFRPLDPAQAERLREAFDTDYTYHSNRIEGSTLTHSETHLVVNKGVTIGGKPLRDHLEAINHQEAIDFIRALASTPGPITEFDLKQLHALVVHGTVDRADAGTYRRRDVSVGRYIPPTFLQLQSGMDRLLAFLHAHSAAHGPLTEAAYSVAMHPVELAAQFHEKLVTIHPFIDGNGRTARLTMNLILLRAGYPITVITSDDASRAEYYDALYEANTSPAGDNTRFQRFVAENVRRWLLRYLSLVSVDVSLEGKSKGGPFFNAIADSMAAYKAARR